MSVGNNMKEREIEGKSAGKSGKESRKESGKESGKERVRAGNSRKETVQASPCTMHRFARM